MTEFQSCNPTPGHISRENYNLKRYMHPNVFAAQFTIATYVFIDNQMDKEDVVCMYVYTHTHTQTHI